MCLQKIALQHQNCGVMLLFMTTLLHAVPVHSEDMAKEALFGNYTIIDHSINHGNGYGKYDNYNGTLAWGESLILESYLDMFVATDDIKYLDKFVKQANQVVKNTDKARGVVDYKNRSLVGWSSRRYSKNNEPMIWAVHSGMITYPLVKFALLVKNLKLDNYSDHAQRYKTVAVEAVKLFDENWVFDAKKMTGYYTQFKDAPVATPAGIPLPFNMQLAVGRTILILYRLTDDKEYLVKATGLAQHFKSFLRTTSNGAYTWDYWYSDGLRVNKAVEDVSHGGVDLDFVLLAYQYGIVFNDDDVVKFIKTYKNIYNDGNYTHFVDGTKPDNKMTGSISSWLELSRYDCSIWKNYASLVNTDTLGQNDSAMFGIAKLLKYYDRCLGK